MFNLIDASLCASGASRRVSERCLSWRTQISIRSAFCGYVPGSNPGDYFGKSSPKVFRPLAAGCPPSLSD
eukprot:1159546-Pelagomonas_calceolata.AAC.6